MNTYEVLELMLLSGNFLLNLLSYLENRNFKKKNNAPPV